MGGLGGKYIDCDLTQQAITIMGCMDCTIMLARNKNNI